MRLIALHPRAFSTGLVLAVGLSFAASYGTGAAIAAPKAKAQKKATKELSSSDDALDKQMDWENKILGPNTEKKIDLAKIQKLQAEETARRERQEKIDRAEKERKEREEAAAAAAKRNVKAAGTHDVPEIEETPPPPRPPVEKHDDAFVDHLLKDKSGPKKKSAAQTNDDIDELLNANKQDKPMAAAKKGKSDSVDQLLATADKAPAIKTTTRRPPAEEEPVSAEAAAREAALKAIAAAAAKNDMNRSKRPAVPDAAVLRARAEASARENPTPPSRPAPAAASKAAWSDPFATDNPPTDYPSKKSRVNTTVRSPDVDAPPPTSGRRGSSRGGNWKDPFDAGQGGGSSPRSKSGKGKSGKHPPNWKDPFA
jgi:hypothetical protein